MDLIVEQIAQAVRACGQVILHAVRSGAMIDEKAGHANFVTTYDRQVQKELKSRLLSVLPEAAFVGEEEEEHASISEGYAFIVDPIDGTTNFIKDYHASAISVGLARDGEPYIGVVYNPYLEEMFTAQCGCGAYLNGCPIHVSKQSLENGIVIFGTSPYYEELAERSFQMAYEYFRRSMDVRRSGSSALDLCNVAAGRAELFFELRLSPWDYAAGALIVTEAGGAVMTAEGEPLRLDRPCSVMAANSPALMRTP